MGIEAGGGFVQQQHIGPQRPGAADFPVGVGADAQPQAGLGWDDLRRQKLAALGYHSPNMELAHSHQLERAATASDQEAVATFILSGCFVGFLPDHYAAAFVQAGRMRAIAPAVLRYHCRFMAISRQSPKGSRLTQAFQQTLYASHASHASHAGHPPSQDPPALG